jgi:hypothetical protein
MEHPQEPDGDNIPKSLKIDGLSVNSDGAVVTSEGNRVAHFVHQLYGILISGNHGDCIEFDDCGVNVTDITRFENSVLPKYFNHSSYKVRLELVLFSKLYYSSV